MSTAETFQRTQAAGRAALVGYWPAGFPDIEGSITAMQTMVAAGCDIIEVGLPYSDPVMDGPTIQQAADQALQSGLRTADLFRIVAAVAGTGAATVVMTYWNPVDRYGVTSFARDLSQAGGSGLITPDITPEYGGDWIAAADQYDLDKVFLVAPSSTPERLALTTAACRGFVYATAVMGVTGMRAQASTVAQPLVERTRATTTLPIGVGLGVANGQQAAEVAAYADGVIVGSAFVSQLLAAPDLKTGLNRLESKVIELSQGVRGEVVRQ